MSIDGLLPVVDIKVVVLASGTPIVVVMSPIGVALHGGMPDSSPQAEVSEPGDGGAGGE